MISDDYFYNLSKSLLDSTEELTLSLIQEIKQIALRLSRGGNINVEAERRKIIARWSDWNENAKGWTDNNLPDAYKKGLSEADKISGDINKGRFVSVPLFGGNFAENISEAARKKFGDLPNHLTMYGVFQEQAYSGFRATQLPVVRSTSDVVRDLSILASDNAYVNADTLTRRQLSQEIMRPFTNRGVTGVVYDNGRRVMLDSYAEMVARTQTGNAARQANFNRLQEYGIDLVLISQHYPTSDLCAPYQGRVFSISGTSDRYEPLQSAISGGLYHPNCKHSQAGYREGQRIPQARESSADNEKRYEITQEQRYNERQIKHWKRRKEGALTDAELQKANSKIKAWQKRQRELIDDNSFLRRRYSREQI